MKRFILGLCRGSLCAAALFVAACQTPIDEEQTQSATYGYYYFGDEKIPVESYITAEGYQFVLKISPLKEDIKSAKTYAAMGVHKALLGMEVDVEFRSHNSDYIFAYEDPVCYYSQLRPLKSGTMMLNYNEAGCVSVKVDVLLYDGTPFRYEAEGLQVTEYPSPFSE